MDGERGNVLPDLEVVMVKLSRRPRPATRTLLLKPFHQALRNGVETTYRITPTLDFGNATTYQLNAPVDLGSRQRPDSSLMALPVAAVNATEGRKLG